MRKRLLIGAIGGVAIVFSACVSSHPTTDTVEWHKARYLHAKGVDEHGTPLVLGSSYNETSGRCGGALTKAQRAELERKAQARETEATRHYRALLEFGYLAERPVIVTGAHTRPIVGALNSWREPFVNARLEEVGTNQLIIVTAPANTVGKYEEFIRKADAPVYEDTVAKIDVGEQ